MQESGGVFGACVWVTQALVGRVPDAEPMLKSIGLLRGGPNALAMWVMPPRLGWGRGSLVETHDWELLTILILTSQQLLCGEV